MKDWSNWQTQDKHLAVIAALCLVVMCAGLALWQSADTGWKAAGMVGVAGGLFGLVAAGMPRGTK